jgi:hypothetical protein
MKNIALHLLDYLWAASIIASGIGLYHVVGKFVHRTYGYFQ